MRTNLAGTEGTQIIILTCDTSCAFGGTTKLRFIKISDEISCENLHSPILALRITISIED